MEENKRLKLKYYREKLWKAYYKHKNIQLEKSRGVTYDGNKPVRKDSTLKGNMKVFAPFSSKLLALFHGWKVRRIMNSNKLKFIVEEFYENFRLRKSLLQECKKDKDSNRDFLVYVS